MKISTDVEFDLGLVDELAPLAEEIKNFVLDYEEMPDVHSDKEWLERAFDLMKKVDNMFE
jgi:hypothetical protein